MPAWNLQTTIDVVHSMVHRGKYFSGGYYNPALANNGTLDLYLQGSGLHNTHLTLKFNASAEFTVTIFESPTVSAAGTGVTMSNHNTSSSNVFSGTATHTPTVTATGNAINGVAYVTGGNGGNATGGSLDEFTSEFLLDKTKNFLFRATNISGQAIRISGHLNVYQPTL